MKPDKARDHFSAYAEGTLDRGLRQAFERRLRSDESLAREFHEFEEILGQLDALKAPIPEPDFDLHDRIKARLDRYDWEQKRRAKSGVLSSWKSLLAAGLAVGALAFAILNNSPDGRVSSASLAGSGSAVLDRVQLQMTGDAPVLTYQPSGTRTVVIKDAKGQVMLSRTLKGDLLRSELSNRADAAESVTIETDGASSPVSVFVPGRRMQAPEKTSGTLRELALSAADYFRVVIAIEAPQADLSKPASWEFSGTDPFQSLSKALAESPWNAEMRSTGIVWITPR
ncbi:MAG: hypothetical protein EDM74_01685 [Armatimonadetes bacterium]|nr:MAG: hypothetical protein EDM74_01685 [Armatimonadota bacterium]